VKAKRLLLVASGGGHWVQLSRLAYAFEGLDTLYVSTLKGSRAPSGDRSVAVVSDASQSEPARVPVLVAQMALVLLKFRPSVIVTTGAAPGLVALWLGRLLGAKTIWIDSIANSEELSLSGRLVRRHADLWLTQWPHLTEKYPGLQCYGSVL
jgi:hypothetical protein